MKHVVTLDISSGLILVLIASGAIGGPLTSSEVSDTPHYDSTGRLLFPADYRDWTFLSSGLNMSYDPGVVASGMNMFGNTFAPRSAYAAYTMNGLWPDKTVLIIENRVAATKGSINKHGQFQTTQTMAYEAHVKDTARFRGGWGFFAFSDSKAPAAMIPYAADCYSCHRAHAASDTTFVQFYPTLLPIAAKLKTLSPAYLADEKAAEGSR